MVRVIVRVIVRGRVMVRVRVMVRLIVRLMVRVRVRVGGGTFAIDEVSIVGVVGDELADGGGPQRPDVALDAHAALVAGLVRVRVGARVRVSVRVRVSCPPRSPARTLGSHRTCPRPIDGGSEGRASD